jgi:hypothetical protein
MEAIPDPEYMLCRDEWLAAANAARFPLFSLQLSVIRYGHKVLAYYSIWILGRFSSEKFSKMVL